MERVNESEIDRSEHFACHRYARLILAVAELLVMFMADSAGQFAN